MELTTRVNLVRNLHSTTEKPKILVSVAADLCGFNRSRIYYSGKPVSDTELECKAIIDHLHTDHPTCGAWQMAAQLKYRCYHIGRKKARLWMTEMAIDPIYPKPHLSKCLQKAAVVPYLLRNADITRPNQAWSIDITWIERWFRSFKYEEAYLTEWHNIKEAQAAISSYIHSYNFERCHSAIGDVTLASVYYPAMLYEVAKGAE